MSLTPVIPFNQKNKPNFGENQGVWEYKDIEGQTLGYVARKQKDGKKYFLPFTYQDGKWVNKWFKNIPKPFYNLNSLRNCPEKPVLIVEGEKTADAAMRFFPDFNVLSWMGGANACSKLELEYLAGLSVYLLPDNDKTGYDAMESIRDRLIHIAANVYLIDIASLDVSQSWDIADLEEGEIDFWDIENLMNETKPEKKPSFDLHSYPYPNLNSKKVKPLDTTENLKHLLNHFQISCHWNMMSRVREIKIPNLDFYYEEQENAALTYITNLAVSHLFPIGRIDQHLDLIAWEKIFHPVRDWILSKPLSNPGIFDEFKKCIKTTNDEFSYKLLKRWMVSAVAAAFNDGNFCPQGVLVIQGEGGTHKSSFILSLAPENMRLIKGNLTIDPSKKDDIFTSSEFWIAELAELDATFRKADIARLKGHITNDIDIIRRSYAKKNSRLIRRSVLAATVNESKFLVDTTGNRRWWTISVTEPINTRHGLDMQQVWREIYELWKKGESPTLTSEELRELNKLNEEFEFIDPFDEKIDAHFDFNWPDRIWMTSSDVLMQIGYDKPSKSDATRMGSILSKRNIPKGSGRLRRCYHMPILQKNVTF